MKDMTPTAMSAACNGKLISSDNISQFSTAQGVVIDSRLVHDGFVFVAICGENMDGHQYIDQAYANGAMIVISEKQLNTTKPYILVQSTRQALKDLAAFYLGRLNTKVVGISGSVGKTSTREFIASVLAQKYNVHKTAGNFNNELGLPLTIFQIRDEHQVAVLEMGISDFGEMHRLAAISRPDVAVLTNIGPAHLESLGSRAGVLKAKTEMFDHLRDNAYVILNGDDDMLCTIPQVQGKSPIFYGIGTTKPNNAVYQNKSIYADNIQNLGLNGIQMTLHIADNSINVHIPTPGEHRVYNALAAATVGHQMGLCLDEIRRGLESVQMIQGRTNLIHAGNITVIDDCYNANPLSMQAAIDLLSSTQGRTIAVLGDMGELGSDSSKMHYDIGRYLAGKDIDVLFCAGTLAHELARGARENTPQCDVHEFNTRDEMLQELLPFLHDGDSVLVKASHFMQFTNVVTGIITHHTSD
ncbi:MAG: UDP-N-acetylmuramoyl-tripeptide--D-alanyl-D-alanine ligase [Alphaproteobacteria bacterium]|nr:UDP-N-acetylmuramoyl-tripeptide--D-alanyl-D-alanine ligase [Alphaproteobacteria bacterium]